MMYVLYKFCLFLHHIHYHVSPGAKKKPVICVKMLKDYTKNTSHTKVYETDTFYIHYHSSNEIFSSRVQISVHDIILTIRFAFIFSN